jgi:uncharacterized protein (TIGR02996 family)
MRTHADAFFQDILANPDDDTPRLVYADWLDEHGDPDRAEFVRLQCRLAGLSAGLEERRALGLRQQLLLHRHVAEWARPVRGLVRAYQFHRGFVGEVWMEEPAFRDTAERLFRLAPVQHLHLGGWRRFTPRERDRSVPALAACPHLARIRTLDLSLSYLGSDGVGALAVGEHFTRLTTLDLSRNLIGDGGARALAGSALLGRLKRLDLSVNQVGSAGLRVLAEALERLETSAEGLRLRVLRLAGNPLPASARQVVRSSPLLRRVVRLH